MEPVHVITALLLLGAGAVISAVAAVCRWGRGRGTRFWVQERVAGARAGYAYGEIAVLVVLPLLAQTLIVGGLVAGVLGVDALRDAGASVLIPVAVIGELILWGAALLTTGYRSVMPLWVYPSWLREERRRERDLIRPR